MGRLSRRDTKERLRRMARATVDMERGIYEWPDGSAPVRPDGEPRVERKEILRVGGYASGSHNGGAHLFNDPYYLRQCAYHRARRDHASVEVAQTEAIDAERVLGLGLLMFCELEKRVQADLAREPDVRPQISSQQLMSFTPTFVKLGLELRAREEKDALPALASGDTPAPARVGHLHFNQTIVNMSAAERERFIESQSRHAEQRMNELRQAIDAASASEENLSDPDYVDAEAFDEEDAVTG